MSRSFKTFLVVLAVLLGAAGLTWLHFENRRLQRRVTADAQNARRAEQLRDDNAWWERMLAEQQRRDDTDRTWVRREIDSLRTEIARLEQTAKQHRAADMARTSQDAAAVESNRDPRLGLTRLEYFQNRGRATPSAALETLVWAALSGEQATLADITALNSATRARAEDFIAQLSPEERAAWTPEKLGQLWFTGLFTELSAAQIVGETIVAFDEAIVRLRLANQAGEEKLSLRRTPTGWKVLAPSAAIDHLKKKRSANP